MGWNASVETTLTLPKNLTLLDELNTKAVDLDNNILRNVSVSRIDTVSNSSYSFTILIKGIPKENVTFRASWTIKGEAKGYYNVGILSKIVHSEPPLVSEDYPIGNDTCGIEFREGAPIMSGATILNSRPTANPNEFHVPAGRDVKVICNATCELHIERVILCYSNESGHYQSAMINRSMTEWVQTIPRQPEKTHLRFRVVASSAIESAETVNVTCIFLSWSFLELELEIIQWQTAVTLTAVVIICAIIFTLRWRKMVEVL